MAPVLEKLSRTKICGIHAKHPIHQERTVGLLLSGDYGELGHTQTKILEHLLETNRELDRLVRMVLDIYKYRNGEKQLQIVAHDPCDSINVMIAAVSQRPRMTSAFRKSALQ